MKILLLTASLIVPFVLSAQIDTANYNIINHPYYNGERIEKKSTKMKVKSRALGYGGADTNHEVAGVKSDTRIDQLDSVYFIVNSKIAAFWDISSGLALLKADVKRNKRIFNIGKYRMFAGIQIGGNVITCTAMDIGGNLVKIIPDEQLTPGEYAYIHKAMNAGVIVITICFCVVVIV